MKSGMKWVSFNSLSELPTASGGLVEVFVPADNLKLIAKLQTQTGHRGHLQIGPAHSRNSHAETIVEIEFANGFAERAPICDHHASEGDVALLEDEGLRHSALPTTRSNCSSPARVPTTARRSST